MNFKTRFEKVACKQRMVKCSEDTYANEEIIIILQELDYLGFGKLGCSNSKHKTYAVKVYVREVKNIYECVGKIYETRAFAYYDKRYKKIVSDIAKKFNVKYTWFIATGF